MIIGIDPGTKGGVALLDDRGKLVNAVYMPSDMDLYHLLSKQIVIGDSVYIEKAAPRPTDGRQSVFSNGKHYGVYLTILNIINEHQSIEIHEIPPITWKSAFGLTKDKDKSMIMCEYIFPESKQYIYGLRGGKLDGIAESILIAHYGYLDWNRRINRGFNRDGSRSNKHGIILHGNNSSNSVRDLSVHGVKERSKKNKTGENVLF